MTLTALIGKGDLAEIATATPATIATLERWKKPSVASVATVAVAWSQNSFNREVYQERVAIMETNGIPHEWAEGKK